MLKTYKDQDYGFAKGNVLAINIQRIWLESGSEPNFIREFAKTYSHELLHIILPGIAGWKNIKDSTEIGEEKIIRKLCKEQWNREIEKSYN